MGTPQTRCHFNMLDLHETVRTLSQYHHFVQKKCTCQMQSTMGTPHNMVSLQAETQVCWERLNGWIPARAPRDPARAPRDVRQPTTTTSTSTTASSSSSQQHQQSSRSSSRVMHRWAGNAFMVLRGKAC